VFKAQSTLFVLQAIGIRNQATIKPNMCYINCHHINHNIKTCKNKKEEEPTIIVTKSTIRASKPPKPLDYPCHTCGMLGHKLTNCSRFGEMQNMFKDQNNRFLGFMTHLYNYILVKKDICD
jgi:hypothetical protein